MTLVAVLSALSAVLAAGSLFFAFQAFRTAHSVKVEADRRWDDMVRPRPRLTFTSAPTPNQPIEVEVENLGGTLAAGAVVAAYGEDLFACELTLPDKAPPRRITMPPVLKAWQRARQPAFLMVAGRDVSGRWWDCLDGMKVIKDPRRWAEAHLKDLRLQGAVSFPELSGSPRSK
ncbi:MAG TPA: hypothetical protein VKT20_10640 [Candidatus Dormibacteraeota bacterium]|nr:hypothetical protein [Candidatus Dormibacteraeota bacterium]